MSAKKSDSNDDPNFAPGEGVSNTPPASQPSSAAQAPAGQAAAPASIEELLRFLMAGGRLPVPISIQQAPFPSDADRALMTELNDRLAGRRQVPVPRADALDRCISPISVAFPPCADVMLSLIRADETDELTSYFNDYFQFCDHSIVADTRFLERIDPDLLACTAKWFEDLSPSPCLQQLLGPGESREAAQAGEPGPSAQSAQVSQTAQPARGGRMARRTAVAASSGTCAGFPYVQPFPPSWPPPWCLPPSCVTLSGTRHLYDKATVTPADPIRRLFIGDLVWLFYFERMGIFKILGVILDDYARTGRFPLINRNGIVPLVMESMTRVIQQGVSSRVSDRAASYRRCLGWNSDVGRKLNLDTSVNTGFNNLFHRFIQNALEFYSKKQLAVAIQATAVPGRASVATLVTVSDTLDLLKKAFDPFDYGRSYSNTLSGIVWVIAGMALIREVRSTLGIPPEFEQPYEFIPAAYDIVVLKRPPTPSEANRYTMHRECANDARDILMDLEVVNHLDNGAGGELELWLEIIEEKVEGYRTAYRALTGVDLGTPATSGLPAIEQQA